MGSLPYNIRVNVNVPFPALVTGAAGIKVTKSNGIWTIQPDFSAIAPAIPPQTQFIASYLEVWNSITGVYSTISLSTLSSITGSTVPTFVSQAGTYTVLSTDNILLINRTVPGAGSVQMPLASTRGGFPVTVKDLAGDAGSGPHPTTVLFTGGETCDGLASVPINSDYGAYKFVPLDAGNWTILP